MKLVVLSRYTRIGASSRLRTMQYAPFLAAEGIELRFAPLFPEAYLSARHGRGAGAGLVLAAYAGRIAARPGLARADLIWLEKEALPFLPWSFERALLPRGVPIVADYDDALFHRYDLHPRPWVRWLLGRKIDRVMAAAALVTAGNPYLAERARRAGAAQVDLVPTVVDTARYALAPEPARAGPPCLGWIGSPSTWRDYMVPMLPLLGAAAEAAGARIRVVGAGPQAEAAAVITHLPWSEQDEVAQIQAMDIGLMPLADTPWARGKCGYKILQYMACGLPVIASPVGVNAEIVRHGETGFLASSPAEWREAILRLAADPALRRRMGAAGRRRVEANYSLAHWGPRLAQRLAALARASRP